MRILICSDGHDAAELAVRFIAALAPEWKAEVVLLGIVEEDPHRAALEAALNGAAEILRQRKVPVEVLTRAGSAIDEIRRYTQRSRFEFVAIGAVRKGNGPFALSQKAYDLVRELDHPVMIVPGTASPVPREAGRILLCSGGRKCLDPALRLAVRLAAGPGLPVTLLHVLPEAPALYDKLLEREIDPKRLLASRSALARQLRRDREALKAEGVTAEVVLRNGPVASEILKEMREQNFLLVVMGSAPEQGAVRNYVMGNVAASVLRDAEIPVLMMKTAVKRPGWMAWLRGKLSEA